MALDTVTNEQADVLIPHGKRTSSTVGFDAKHVARPGNLNLGASLNGQENDGGQSGEPALERARASAHEWPWHGWGALIT